MEVGNNCKISGQYLQNDACKAKKSTGRLGVNTTVVGILWQAGIVIKTPSGMM